MAIKMYWSERNVTLCRGCHKDGMAVEANLIALITFRGRGRENCPI